MGNVLNSDMVQWLLKWGLSRSGAAVAFVTTWLITKLNLASFVPADDVATINHATQAFLLAVVAGVYAWIVKRQKDGVRVLQEIHNQASPESMVKVDGIAGNSTVKTIAKASDVSIFNAIDKVDITGV